MRRHELTEPERHTRGQDGGARADLERLAERALDIIYRYRLEPERGFDYVSPAATRVTGYTPEEHYADPDLGFKLVHPDDHPLLADLTVAPSSDPLMLRWRRKDGRTIWTEQRNSPVYDEDGRLVAIEGIAREIVDPTRQPEATTRLVGGLRIDLPRQRVHVNGRSVHLTPSELRLLVLLTERADQVLSRKEIMRHLWRSSHVGSAHACETHISTLRRKIEPDPRFPELIVTVRGRGYRFVSGTPGSEPAVAGKENAR